MDKRRLYLPEEEICLKYITEQISMIELGKYYKCSSMGIEGVLKRNNIKLRNMKEVMNTPELVEKLSGENNPIHNVIFSEETIEKMRYRMQGRKNYAWKGGVSFGKYCPLFNETFKKLVRDSFHNKCFLCNKTKKKNGRELDVHHINYNKNCLCRSSCEFIPLCRKCHSETNFNRQYWEDLIMHYLYPERYFLVSI